MCYDLVQIFIVFAIFSHIIFQPLHKNLERIYVVAMQFAVSWNTKKILFIHIVHIKYKNLMICQLVGLDLSFNNL
jgi:hypothetical protein